MEILEFEINGYEGISYLKMENIPKDVVLIGENGSGKSTVLRALRDTLENLFSYERDPKSSINPYFPQKIRIKISLTESISQITNWTDKFIVNNEKNSDFGFLGAFPNINQSQDYNFQLNHPEIIFLKSLKFDIFKQNPIIEITNKGCRTFLNLESWYISPYVNSNLVRDKRKKLESLGISITDNNDIMNYYFGFIILRCLKDRFYGNKDVPGFSYLNMENINPRNVTIQYGNIVNVTKERSDKLKDPNWRISNLGTRLASLMFKFANEFAQDPIKANEQNPISRINRSLSKMVPHLQIAPPSPEIDQIIPIVRGQELKIKDLSTGEIYLLSFAIDYLEMEVNNGIILIDEPSVHLHYHLQSRFVAFIKELVNTPESNPSIWISTHSAPIINSVSENSLFKVDINKENAISRVNLDSDQEKYNLNQVLGMSFYYDRKPILFVEGKTDYPSISKLLDKFGNTTMKNWIFKPVNSIENVIQLEDLSDQIIKFARSKKVRELELQVKQNHFLKDGDNKREHKENSKSFTWNFYHIENIIFQEPWVQKILTLNRMSLKNDPKVSDIIDAAKEAYNEMENKPDNISFEEDGNWRCILPGREIYKKLKKKWNGGGKIPKLISSMVDETSNIDELPNEFQRFLKWMDEKYDNWKINS